MRGFFMPLSNKPEIRARQERAIVWSHEIRYKNLKKYYPPLKSTNEENVDFFMAISNNGGTPLSRGMGESRPKTLTEAKT
jgi:hypothetical protein